MGEESFLTEDFLSPKSIFKRRKEKGLAKRNVVLWALP